MKIRVWGARGSHPVSGAEYTKVGGNTPCVEIRAGKHIVILDAGTGIINLGNQLLQEHFTSGDNPYNRKPIEVVMFFSHMHYDHQQGFPFFKPAYLPSSILHVYGPKFYEDNMDKMLRQLMVSPYFPVAMSDLNSKINIHTIHQAQTFYLTEDTVPVVLDNFRDHEKIEKLEKKIGKSNNHVKITVLKSYAHPRSGVLIYKIQHQNKTFVYASDTEGYQHGDQRLIQFAQGADILIHDAQYTPDHYTSGPVPTQGWGHSTYEMACAVAKAAKVGKLLLFHHDPSYNDDKIEGIVKKAKNLFSETEYAHEGWSAKL